MKSVFELQHVHSLANGDEDVKFIGVYSSLENAETAVRRLSNASGFADDPDGFQIDKYRIDQDQWVGGYAALAEA